MIKGIITTILAMSCSIVYASTPIILNAVQEPLTINGKTKTVYDIIQPDGTKGYTGTKNTDFDVILKNEPNGPISIHWHGIIFPNNQDGAPYVTQLPTHPGNSRHYHYKLLQAGTFWMHSH